MESKTSLSPTAERLLTAFTESITESDDLAQHSDMMAFMLRNLLAGKSDEEVRNTVSEVYDTLTYVLYPPLWNASESTYSIDESPVTPDADDSIIDLAVNAR